MAIGDPVESFGHVTHSFESIPEQVEHVTSHCRQLRLLKISVDGQKH